LKTAALSRHIKKWRVIFKKGFLLFLSQSLFPNNFLGNERFAKKIIPEILHWKMRALCFQGRAHSSRHLKNNARIDF